MQQWLTGHKLKNRPYEILQILGEGGFGITYKAKNLSLDVPVVIKTPNRKLQRDKNYSKYLESFKKEAKQLAKLGMNPHPHIVRVFDFFEEDNLPCIIMDYVPGNSLYDLVQMNGVLAEERALEYIRQIGSALSVCHQRGIIHRDVHPNNILIHAESGKAILIDFGISGTTQSSRNTRSGNQAFAPWEQLISFGEQSSKTPQVDIYTLAASFYYLITGDTPTPSLARKFNNDDLIEPKQHNFNISDRINKAILKGIEIEPSDRPQTIKAWLEMLNTTQLRPTKQESTLPQQNPVRPKSKTQLKIKEVQKFNVVKLFNFETVKIKGIKVISSGFLGFGKKKEAILNREQRQAKYFIEDLGNGATLDMMEIPAGTFLMGSPEHELGRKDNESPQHQVLVTSFYMAKFEVTQAQWKRVAALPQIEKELKPDPSRFKGDNLPVERVNWDEVVEYCTRLSKATGKEYRLPSQAEWEYACRAGTTTPFHFGKTITTELVNYYGNDTYANAPKGEYREQTTPVGTFPPNAFGLYDMHGNVWEWCEDDWHDSYRDAPDDGSVWAGETSSTKAMRGGSWLNNPHLCRSAFRLNRARDDRSNFIGFRVVCVSPRAT